MRNVQSSFLLAKKRSRLMNERDVSREIIFPVIKNFGRIRIQTHHKHEC